MTPETWINMIEGNLSSRERTMTRIPDRNQARFGINRRAVLGRSAAMLAFCAGIAGRGAAAQVLADPLAPLAMPPQAPAKEGIAQLADTRLWFWDTGGSGEPIVLLHPASGSGLIWGYQQPAFAKAGYRVIAYSRRGYYNSAPSSRDKPGIGSEDLHHLVEFLRLTKFHLVASAAGGSIASDYAFTHQDCLLSRTISCSSFRSRDARISSAALFIRVKKWDD